jgi:F-type H+-transporting ATPase subunit delta
VQAGSVRSMTAVLEKTQDVLQPGSDAGRLGDDLFAFALTLDAHHALRRALTEPAVPGEVKSRLLHSLVEGKIAAEALEVVDVAVQNRWSRSRDLADSLERASVAAHVASADAEGNLDTLEDNLFRFDRIVEADPGLRELLSDSDKSLEGKRKLLHTLLDGKVDDSTARLLGQAVAARHHSLSGVLEMYQQVAADRRKSLVATVWVAAPLSEDHKDRLATALAEEYAHEVHLNVIIDPEVLGGVRVAVRDEVIDASVESRLKQAHRRLEQ